MALPFQHDLERLDERKARLEQGGQLLAEDEQKIGGDARPDQAQLLEDEAAPYGEKVVALLLELGAEGGLVGGHEGALDHLSGRHADLADVFHVPLVRRSARRRGRQRIINVTATRPKLQVLKDLRQAERGQRAFATTRVASSSAGRPPDQPWTSPRIE